jgi:ketosteroid isomerase-like protein
MSQENVEIIERALAALGREDWEAALAHLSPEAEIHDHDIPDADVYRGLPGFLTWISHWGESWETWTVEDLEVRAAGADQAVALFRMVATGRGSGVKVDTPNGVVCTFDRGQLVRVDYFGDPRDALEAVGLSE